MDWDAKLGIANILKSYTVPKVIAEYFPGGIFGFDKEGSPVVYQLVGFTDFKGLLYSARTDDILKSRAYLAEQCLKLCREQTEKLGKPITGVTLIYDLEGLGLKHLWRPGVKLFNSISSLFEERYPTLPKRILVIRSGKLFPVAFALAKPFLSEETKKKIFVFGSDWQSELKKFVDPSEFPAYYGGDCKDPDGDPMCKSKICYGGDVPASYYINRDDVLNSEDCKQIIVKAGDVYSIQQDVKKPETVIAWEFKTAEHDIGFSVTLLPNEDSEGAKKSLSVLPFDKKQSHLVPEDAMIVCEKVGTYFINFDNSYSWTRSKKLFYRVNFHEPSSEGE